jgi:hypothetical protein
MGLGKTAQAICFLGVLSDWENDRWGWLGPARWALQGVCGCVESALGVLLKAGAWVLSSVCGLESLKPGVLVSTSSCAAVQACLTPPTAGTRGGCLCSSGSARLLSVSLLCPPPPSAPVARLLFPTAAAAAPPVLPANAPPPRPAPPLPAVPRCALITPGGPTWCVRRRRCWTTGRARSATGAQTCGS